MKTVRRSVLVAAVLCSILLAFPAVAGSSGGKALSLEGAWLGTLNVPPTPPLRIVFNIHANADGSLSGTLDSPDQGATGIGISRISVEKEQVKVEVSVVGGRFEGKLNAEGSEMSGQWKQAGTLAGPGDEAGERGPESRAAAGAQEAVSLYR